MFQELTQDQQELALAMGEISEAAYAAAWMTGLEFVLWYLVESKKRQYRRYAPSEVQMENLRRLSAKCGGWIAFDDRHAEVFISLAEWRVKFSREGPGHIEPE